MERENNLENLALPLFFSAYRRRRFRIVPRLVGEITNKQHNHKQSKKKKQFQAEEISLKIRVAGGRKKWRVSVDA